MNYAITILIFLVVVFFYIHVTEQYKKSEDLEIYEMDFVDNAALQNVCNVKQPVLFEYKSHVPEIFGKITIDNILRNGGQYEVAVKDTNDYAKSGASFDYITFPFHSTIKLFETDSRAHFISESNSIFVEESGLNPIIHAVDLDLKPPLTVHTAYDILFGSKGSTTPLRYHTGTRYFVGVTAGKIQIKMTPWRSTRYLKPIRDYENYEFRSAIDVWTKDLGELSKIKFLEFDVIEGNVLYIPPYWWYSIKYMNEDADTVSMCFACQYNTAVNILANITDIGRYYLQQQNITEKTARILPTTTQDSDTEPDINMESEIKPKPEPIVVLDQDPTEV